jgi:antagonist of KipI
MSTLVVESPGMLTTVQDLGRMGLGTWGVSPSGAADPVAMRLGNLLVGNPEGAAVLEMTLLGGKFVFPEGAVVALTGGDFGAMLDGRAFEMWATQTIAPGGRLELGGTKNYARCYLAVAGSIRVTPLGGSAATHLMSGLGGLEGRALRRGDALKLGRSSRRITAKRVSQAVLSYLKPRKKLRVVDGPQSDEFSGETKREFFRTIFRVSEESNRLGMRLEGGSFAVENAGKMITEGVTWGAVQVPPSGQPIILGVEQQTTGGYPKIANVIGVDLHRMGQLRPRDEIRFERTSLAAARSSWIEQERLLSNTKQLFT